jgi:hypothetical protein
VLNYKTQVNLCFLSFCPTQWISEALTTIDKVNILRFVSTTATFDHEMSLGHRVNSSFTFTFHIPMASMKLRETWNSTQLCKLNKGSSVRRKRSSLKTSLTLMPTPSSYGTYIPPPNNWNWVMAAQASLHVWLKSQCRSSYEVSFNFSSSFPSLI